MSSSIKPRYKHTDPAAVTATSTTASNNHNSSRTNDYNKSEKDEKIRQKEFGQLRCLIVVICFVTVCAGYAGFKHRRNKRMLAKGLKGGLGTVQLPNKDDMARVPDLAETLGITPEALVEKKLVEKVKVLDKEVRQHKAKPGMIMEVDPKGMQLTKELQHWTHKLLVQR